MRGKLYQNHFYHIYNRGNNREDLFVEELDYYYFLSKYWEYCYPALDTYAYCLLRNHFHLLIRVREPKEFKEVLKEKSVDRQVKDRLAEKKWTPKLVSQQIAHAFNGYAQTINNKYERTGSLFERPFERKKVHADEYFRDLVCYIHLNPQNHGLVDDFRDYPFSSYSRYVTEESLYINLEFTLTQFGGKDNFLELHNRLFRLNDEFKFQ